MKGLSIIIPVKPPEPYLPTLIKETNYYLQNTPHEILVQTEEGLTNAIIQGVENSQYDTIAVMDADGSHHPFFLLMLCKGINPPLLNHDLVIASRFGRYSEMPRWRAVISRVYCWLARFLLKLKVKDPMSGYVVGTKKLFQQLQPSTDYKFILQLLIHITPIRVLELPYTLQKRQKGTSKATMKTGLKTLSSILTLWWNK